MSEYSRIPAFFPMLATGDTNTRRLVKSSLIRHIAEAQNFLWSHGRVYAAHGYEGNGNKLYNRYDQGINEDNGQPLGDGRELEVMTDGVTALCVCAFLVPRNWNKKNAVRISSQLIIPTGGAATMYVRLENKNGSLITEDSATPHAAGTQDVVVTLEVPSTGEYQMRVLFSYDYSGVSGADEGDFGHDVAEITHVSARYSEDSTVDTTWFDFNGSWAFSDDYPVASVFLQKLVRNTIHLWARRTPEICQASLMRNYVNTSTYTQVARYIAFVNHKVDELAGQLVVNCTHSGAGNEVRLKMDGVVVQTFAALSAGLQTLTLTPFAVTGNAERIFTVESKSTAASADWGTVLLGVQIWENDTAVSSPPAGYVPLDFNALEGDDAITAQTVNAYSQNAGLDLLFKNDKWLAHNRLKVLVGDWCHRTLKNAVEFAAGDVDSRVAWTYSWFYGDKPRNMTIGPFTDPVEEDQDAMVTFDADFEALADTVNGYQPAGPYTYPNELRYTNYGQRVGLYNIFAVFSGVENEPQLLIKTRCRRVRPYSPTNDVDGAGPLGADIFYQCKGFINANLDAGASEIAIHTPGGIEDWKPQWLVDGTVAHEVEPYNLQLAGRLRPQYESFESDPPAFVRPEGMMFEMEMCSAYVADTELTEADLKELF